jgi:hypothetical protein
VSLRTNFALIRSHITPILAVRSRVITLSIITRAQLKERQPSSILASKYRLNVVQKGNEIIKLRREIFANQGSNVYNFKLKKYCRIMEVGDLTA